MSVFLGIHDGHNASAALLRDGRLELALQEERLTRVKNQGDAPERAAALALKMARSMAGGGVAGVALNGQYMNYGQWRRQTIVADYEGSSSLLSRGKQALKGTSVDRAYQRRKARSRGERLRAAGIGGPGCVPIVPTVPVEHHLAHAAAAYYTSPWAAPRSSERVLVLTCDGSGDRLSATVSIGAAGRLERIAAVSEHDSLGRLYALVTRHLAMLPLEHEYKVMGLAPYAASSSGAAALAQAFLDLFQFEPSGLAWRRARGVPSLYSAFDAVGRMLAGERFDTAAAGVQMFLERMLTAWVRHAIRETGIAKLACSGGVFMNVKANLAILELPEVEQMYVVPSCGDESNSIGAAAYLAAQAGESVEPLGPLYFGEPISDAEAAAALEAAAGGNARCGRLRFAYHPDIEQKTAAALALGRIVARASGPAEFGARALGNRSILARADAPSLVPWLNHAIKGRDFWMPFAPSVLAERAAEYYEKPKSIASPHMMFAFRSKAARRAAFCCAQHPHDFTTRPHEVFPRHNPAYHRLLQEFEARTGQGIVLNTSFNLHGEPMVGGAADAVGVFLRSGLEHMALGNFWVEKSA